MLGRAWCSAAAVDWAAARAALPSGAAASGADRRGPPGTGGPASVGSEDVPLSSRHPGAVGDRLDRPWMQMCEIAATAPLVIGYRTARMLTGGWPPSARTAGSTRGCGRRSRGLHAGGDGRGDRATRPGRGRAGPDPGASSGARQRPAAVPRVSRPARTARGRSARGLARQELNLELMVRRRVPAHPDGPLPASTPHRTELDAQREMQRSKAEGAKNSAPLPGKLSTPLTNIRPSCARQPAPRRKPTDIRRQADRLTNEADLP